MNARYSSLIVALALCMTPAGVATAAAAPTTLQSLLREMIDRDAIARLPEPWYTCRQASSYDRKSASPDDQKSWFANGDASQYLRVETNGDRKEWVMMDAHGPGAIVRIWSANPKGTLRIYLDHESQPALEAPMNELLGSKWSVGSVTVGQPLSAERSRGWNLYLPIPYSRHCKITSDSDGFYYQVNYRTYESGARVTSFTTDQLVAASSLLNRAQQTLTDLTPEAGKATQQASGELTRGGTVRLALPPGAAAVTTITCTVSTGNYAEALRQLVISGEFDGESTIWAPVGDFFGSGIGVNTFGDWYRSVTSDGGATLTARWIMPYQKTATLQLTNLGDEKIKVQLNTATMPWTWDNRSMHLYARWRQEDPIATRPMHDWNYINIRGQGVYVGDSLAVANPVKDWWGEGDEKIYVDSETFPSHFGTGTEDYYGYAWCWPETFTDPFHAQPRCDGPGNYGHTSVSRVRLLDGIPFRKSLNFDMEVWHWADCNEGYAATTFVYARPGAFDNRPPQPEEAMRGALDPPPLPPPPPPYKIAGAIECEEMSVTAHSKDLDFGSQEMGGFGAKTWSGDSHLWVRAKKVGDYIEVEVPCDSKTPVKVIVHATQSWDYGIMQFSVNGRKAGKPVDLYSGKEGVCKASGPIELGSFMPAGGKLVLRAEVVGGNPEAAGTHAFFGLDCIMLEPVN